MTHTPLHNVNTMPQEKIVAYYRVSTKQQGESGLGLEGQVASVEAYSKANHCIIIKSYKEVESGKRSDRPELARALAHARRAGAALVIAKLDRLSRNVHFLSGLMESGVEFKACDNPHANRLTVHILASVAEDEARRISERTRVALLAAKARGTRLGAAREGARRLTPEDAARGRRAAAGVRADQAHAAYADLAGELAGMREAGLTLRAIAAALNEEGHTTRQGKPWNPEQVSRVLKRFL